MRRAATMAGHLRVAPSGQEGGDSVGRPSGGSVRGQGGPCSGGGKRGSLGRGRRLEDVIGGAAGIRGAKGA